MFAFSQRQQFRGGRQTQVELVWLPKGSPALNVFSHCTEFIVQLRIVSAKQFEREAYRIGLTGTVGRAIAFVRELWGLSVRVSFVLSRV